MLFVFVAGPRSTVEGVFVAGPPTRWMASSLLATGSGLVFFGMLTLQKPGSGEVLRHAGVGRVQVEAVGGWGAGRGGRRLPGVLLAATSSSSSLIGGAPDPVIDSGWTSCCVQYVYPQCKLCRDRRNSPGAVLGPVVYMPVIVQRGAQFGLAGRRHPCRGAHPNSYNPSIQKIIQILLLQYIDKVIDVGCRSCSSRCIRGEDSRAPTVAPIAWTVVAMPVIVQRQLLWSRRLKTAKVPQLQYVFVVDVPVVQIHLASSLGQGR